MTVDEMIDGIVTREGGYVNHSSDPGGATRYGITERVARANGYNGDMKSLSKETAKRIYLQEYVIKPGFLAIAEIDPLVAEEVIDSGVNAGQKRSAMWFQKALNVFNRRQVDYADIVVDGDIGGKTIAAYRALIRKRKAVVARRLMLRALNGLQFMHYYNLAENGTKFEDFFPGWVDGRIS